jgi:hypothetical protein
VSEAIGKHESEDSKGIKAHFRMDESGLLTVDSVEAVFETKVESDAEEVGNIVGDAISKFGESISKLFGRTDDETLLEKVFLNFILSVILSINLCLYERLTKRIRRQLMTRRLTPRMRQRIRNPLLRKGLIKRMRRIRRQMAPKRSRRRS